MPVGLENFIRQPTTAISPKLLFYSTLDPKNFLKLCNKRNLRFLETSTKAIPKYDQTVELQ